MNRTRTWQVGALALLLSSGAAVAPASAQSAGEEAEMDRIVIALPNGKRIVRYVPRTTTVAPAPSNTGSSPTGVRPPDTGSGSGSGSGTDTGGENNNSTWEPPDVPDDLARQVAQWLLLYRAGNMQADANGDGQLTPADYSAYIVYLNSRSGGDSNDSSGGDTDGTTDGSGGGGGSDDDADNDDNSYEGWTDLSPAPESRVIYVSSSIGNDSNDGRTEATAVKSLTRGLALIRSGQPDWLLFKRGDTFTGNFGRFEYRGMSPDKPLVIGAYGSGARPRIITGNSPAFNLAGSFERKHIAIMSLQMEPGTGNPPGGIRIVTGTTEDLLVEDCSLKDYVVNILVQGEDTDSMANIRIRRNVLLDAHGSTHAQAIYASHIQGLTIEGNVIDRNGWDSAVGRSNATIFAHNCYIQRSVTGLVFKDNIVMRASSHGLQARMGGTVEGNVFYQNPMAIMFGNEGVKSNEYAVRGTIRHNVILEGIDINADLPRGDGIVLQHTAEVQVTDNILSRNLNAPDSAYGISIDGPDTAPVRNALIANNIVHDWDLPFRVHDLNAISATFRDNILANSDGDKPLIKHRRTNSVNALTYSGNHYLRAGNQDWFQVGSADFTLPEWASEHDSDPQLLTSSFVDDDRTMDTYARSIGFSGAPAMIEAMRSVRKGSWDDRLTADAIGDYFREGFTVVAGN